MRRLTKSRFKLAQECPTKLYYTQKARVYANNKLTDSFLESLAEGGYQIGELAKLYYPDGYDIETLNIEKALNQTNELLKKENVTIFEAAIMHDNLFIRVDILRKIGNSLKVIEVKAKSCEGNNPDQFYMKSGHISSSWSSYLEDVAFQKYVVSKAFPTSNISCYLMLAEKLSSCPSTGLNQKLRIHKDADGRKSVYVKEPLTTEELNEKILSEINVDDAVNQIFNGSAYKDPPLYGFEDTIKRYAEAYAADEKIQPKLSLVCNKCEFKASQSDLEKGFKSGFQECWQSCSGLSETELLKPTVCDLWYPKTDKHVSEGLYLLEQLSQDDINFREGNSDGLTRTERQWLQIERVKDPDLGVYFDTTGLTAEMASHTYPLHFIDFETSAAAIPFMKGMSPYEQIAFQFSHHILYEDGSIEHKSEFIEATPGKFPNFDFIRALKQALSNDNGTIFRYHNHENTILCAIKRQLEAQAEQIIDSQELIEFIKLITHSTGNSVDKWEGERDMVDLQKLVLNYYYDPATNGSNSLKYVLPAVLYSSDFLKDKYSQPIYGTPSIPSLNFASHKWLEIENGKILNPYHRLPPMFKGVSDEIEKKEFKGDQVKDGGEALTAYAILQYVDLTDIERQALIKSLLCYCELDTMAMVMIYEAWKDWV